MRSSVLYTLISLTGMVFGAEIVASHFTQSLVLLISAYHMLYNILSLLLLVFSHRMSKGKTLKNTFGWARVKVLGLLVNMLFLAALCFAAVVEAIQTMVHASHEDTEPRFPMLMLALGVVSLVLNILCFILIGGYTHHQGCSMIIQDGDVQMNCVLVNPQGDPKTFPSSPSLDSKKSSAKSCSEETRWRLDHKVLDISRDISSCLTVIACASIILLMDGLLLKYVDAILALASIVVLMSTTYPFIRESGLILLQSIPSHIDVESLRKGLVAQFPDLLNVHDLHVWRLTTSEVIATVHVILSSPESYASIEIALNQFFQKEGISSATIQPEFTNGLCLEKTKTECILHCSLNNNCGALTCCGPLVDPSKSTVRQRNVAEQKQIPAVADSPPPAAVAEPQYDFAAIPSATETVL